MNTTTNCSEECTLVSDQFDVAFENDTTSDTMMKHLTPLGPFDRYIDQMPLLGYPGPVFWLIHGSALLSLITSCVVGIALICFLFISRRQNDRGTKNPPTNMSTTVTSATITKSKATPQSKKPDNSFFKWNIGERLVIYLAVADITYEISHTMDHAYVILTQNNPPDLACAVFGFMLTEFGFAQWVIVLYSALSACSLIVFNKKLHLGRWDWILIVAALGIPGSFGFVAGPLGLLGQNGVWLDS